MGNHCHEHFLYDYGIPEHPPCAASEGASVQVSCRCGGVPDNRASTGDGDLRVAWVRLLDPGDWVTFRCDSLRQFGMPVALTGLRPAMFPVSPGRCRIQPGYLGITPLMVYLLQRRFFGCRARVG